MPPSLSKPSVCAVCSIVCRIAGSSELVVRNGAVYRGAEGRIVMKQDKFAPGGLADNFTQQLCRANFSV